VNNNLTKLISTVSGQSRNTVYTYDGDDRPLTVTFANGKVMTDTYDALGRLTRQRLGLASDHDTVLTYKPGADGSQTALVATYQNGSDDAFSYDYDANGNITSISQGSVNVTYEYNSANELIRENNGFTNQTVYCNYLRIVRGIEREEVFKPVEKNFLDSSKRS
jgi:YD repeat-containing protein